MAARMFVRVASAAVIGIEAAPIDVEVDVGVGLPCCNIVGLPDAGIREGRLQTIRTLGGSQRVLLDSVQDDRSFAADMSSRSHSL